MFNYDSRIKKTNISFTAKPMPKKIVNDMAQTIANSKKIGIYMHASPDQDAVGSAGPIYNWLTKLGKDVSIFVNIQETKGLLFDSSKYKLNDGSKAPDWDLAFIVDCNKLKRISANFIDSLKNNKKIIGLDHHTPTTSTIKSLYIDTEAKSCCGIVYRFFESLGEKLNKSDIKSLYGGMVSDYEKSKLISIEKTPIGFKLNKLQKFEDDKYSKEVFEKIESKLSNRTKVNIYKQLDVISNLTPDEKAFQKRIFSEVKVIPNGKLAYLKIEQNDKDWEKIGMDNVRTSAIIQDFRSRIINMEHDDKMISSDLKKNLKNVQGAIIFYRESPAPDSPYRMSITTNGDYAERLRTFIVENLDPNLTTGGHPGRQGGRVLSCEKEDIDKFIGNFLKAAEIIG